MFANSFELKQTISRIQELNTLVKETDLLIKDILDEKASTILSIPGIDYVLGAIIIAEMGDMDRFIHLIKSSLMPAFNPLINHVN